MTTGAYDDSGHRALAGFFYQIVQTAALIVELEEKFGRDELNDGTSCVSIVRPEEYGQDAVAFGENTAKVVQHKFSETPHLHPIRPSELFDIFVKLQDTARRIKEKHNISVTCCLHTNRPLSPYSKKYHTSAVNDVRYKQLDTLVEITVSKNGNDRTFNPGRSEEINQEFRQWLKEVEFDHKMFHDAVKTLEERAAKFGVFKNELSARLARIEGELLAIIARNTARQITLEDLDSWLTGDQAPKELCTQINANEIEQNLTQLARHVRDPEPLLKRTATTTLLQQSIYHTIVQVYGEGGVGKSAVVFEHLLSQLSTPPPFLSARDSRSQLEHWPGDSFVCWRNSTNENLRREPLDTIINRLQLACPNNNRPLLILFLDGIDERNSDEIADSIRRLDILLRREQTRCSEKGILPRVQLFVTCRERNGWNDLVEIDNPFGDESPEVHSIKVDMLSDDDLQMITDRFLPTTVCDRIKQALNSDILPDAPQSRDDLFNNVAPESQNFIDAIRHPPFLASLRRVDKNDVIRAFEGISTCRKTISGYYIKWFAQKVVRRKRFQNERIIYRLLNLIINDSGTTTKVQDYQINWSNPLTTNHVSIVEAISLYDEAISAGIIIQESHDKWRWRNEFACLGVIANIDPPTEV